MTDTQDAAPMVGSADTVNVGVTGSQLPHVRVLAGVTTAILLGFAVVTFWVIRGDAGSGIDAATKGALIQTWSNLALLAGGFWLGSSMSGKLKGAGQ